MTSAAHAMKVGGMTKKTSSFLYTATPSAKAGVVMLAKVHNTDDFTRVTVSVPQVLRDKVAARVKGNQTTALVALAEWALSELQRQQISLLIEDADPPPHWRHR